MAPEISRLKQALDCMVRIVAVRADGAAYVPIVLRLERELSERQKLESEFDRIKKLVTHRAA